jgi:hypothetical protein
VNTTTEVLQLSSHDTTDGSVLTLQIYISKLHSINVSSVISYISLSPDENYSVP